LIEKLNVELAEERGPDPIEKALQISADTLEYKQAKIRERDVHHDRSIQ
jgi:hypothetical protein